jgi:8-oxo-dGTP pyrophosphatase MutT (NUDIX family)
MATLWIDAEHPQAAAIVLLLTPDGRVVLQLRDDIPNIDNPGMITAFGGMAERGETPITCALRELLEETGLQPDPGDLRYVGAAAKLDWRGINTACVCFVIEGIDPAALVITEGRAIVLSLAEIASDPRVTPYCRAMVARISHVPN